MKTIKAVALLTALALLSGCASSIAYRADYVPDKSLEAGERIAGKVLVYTTRSDDDRVIGRLGRRRGQQ